MEACGIKQVVIIELFNEFATSYNEALKEIIRRKSFDHVIDDLRYNTRKSI